MSVAPGPAPVTSAEPTEPAELGDLIGTIDELAGVGVYIWEPQRARVRWSPGFYHLLGIPVARVDTRRFFDHVHPDDRARVAMGWQVALTQGQIDPRPYRLIAADGQLRWVVGRGRAERDAAGNVVRLVGTILDVTDVHEATEQLAEAHALRADTERIAGVGTFRFDIATGKLQWSEQIYRFLGVPSDQPADPEIAAALAGASGTASHLRWRERVLAGEELPPRRVRLTRHDGSIVHLDTIARRLDRPQGAAVVGFVIDVSARVELEEQLRHAATMDAIGTLAAGIAHDFNNYLTVLQVQVDALRAGRRATTAADVATMGEALDRSAALVRQLLAFARRHPFRAEKLDLAAQVDGVVRLFQRVSGPAIDVRWAGAAPIAVEGDAAQLDGAIMNLLVNARDAMPDGGVMTVTLAVDAQRARLSVHDTGEGIPADVLPRIFEPYFTTKAAGAGVGLGLAAVYGTVHQHGGRIEVASTPGGGTTFDVWLPLADHDLALAMATRAAAPSPRLRVLLAEDLDLLRTALAGLLGDEGHAVTAVTDGEEALAAVRAGGKFDVVLSDVVMPRLDGHELRRALAELVPGLPVILMSGYTHDREADGEPWLDKPFTREDLRAALTAIAPRAPAG